MKRSTDFRLRQHQRQRDLGTPTVSVITGVCTKAVEDLRTWAFNEGRNVVWMPVASTAWLLRHLATSAGPLTAALRGAAARHLAQHDSASATPESGVQPCGGRLARRGDARRKAEADAETATALAACRLLLEPETVRWERYDRGPAGMRIARAMLAFLWEVPAPVVVLSTPTDWANTERVRGICEWAAAMTDEDTRLPVVLVARHLPVDFLEKRLDPRVHDRIEAGLITAQGNLRPVLPYLGDEEDEPEEAWSRGDAQRALLECLDTHPDTARLFRRFVDPARAASHCLIASDPRVAVQLVAKAPDRNGLLSRRDDAVSGALRERGVFTLSFFADDVQADADAVADAVRAFVARRAALVPRRAQAEPRKIA